MFSGEYAHQLDEKNRIRIPAKFKIDPNDFMISKGVNHCLYVTPKSVVEEKARKYSEAIPDFDKEGQFAVSVYMASYRPINMDQQGRVTVPPDFLEYAGIKKNVVTVGNFDRLEIWGEETRNSFFDNKTYDDYINVLASRIK